VPYGAGQTQRTLASYYADGSGALVQQVELLLGVPTDHQVRIGLDGFSGVVDAVGGLDGLDGQADGRDLLRYVAEAEDGPTRVARVSEVVRATLQQLGMVHAVTNPGQFDRVLRALEECVLVDSDLTVAEFESTLLESSVRADEIGAVTLATTVSEPGRRAVPNHLAKLRKAVREDTVVALGEPLAASRPR
jgi:anionic cell wall polymer biosynthesis LytR-Cps2A-Psr (LCP) family protein